MERAKNLQTGWSLLLGWIWVRETPLSLEESSVPSVEQSWTLTFQFYMALAIESQNVTRRILENHELNSLILQVGLRGKDRRHLCLKDFPRP